MLATYLKKLETIDPLRSVGRVRRSVGLIVEAEGPAVSVGDICYLSSSENTSRSTKLEVVGFRDNRVLLMPLGQMPPVRAGDTVIATGHSSSFKVGEELLGRTINALGDPLDGLGKISAEKSYPLTGPATNPLARDRIDTALETGVRSIDGLLTVGAGQRIGIFGGSGVGKSTLLGMMAKRSEADINVIAMIGERGREVREFIENELGPDGLARSVVISSTSDDSALVRIRAALAATTVAEYFKDQGANVLLIMDSVTRFCMAQREIGLAAGEPPSSKGYTPSVFALLPKLLERAGKFVGGGSITGFYTVLVEGDDMNEPVADAVRSILDGHIVLSRQLAAQNHYPCIDVLESASRLFSIVTEKEHELQAGRVRELISAYSKAEDLINIGAYESGSNPKIDRAIERHDEITAFLRQAHDENANLEDSISRLLSIETE
ncbi:MAG: FliI/YscN family ATPase [Pyrinomonadaceae bacterium]|nr:FliI/YscN family ATPase [Pyrinomonadaceae bacterium]